MTIETVLGSLENLCLSEHLADVNFILDNGATKLPAHKLVLAMRSEVFEAMFYGLLKDTTDEIRIVDIKADVFKRFLRYAYTDTTNLEATDIVECLHAATKYSLHGLVAKCSEAMKSCISTANVCTLYEQAQLYNVADLADRCFTYILENVDEVMKTSDFCCLSYKSVCRVLSSEEIYTPEMENFTALYNWAVLRSTGKGEGTSPTSIRQTMGDSLFLVRLPLVPVATFTDVVMKHGVLTADEALNIYQYLTTKSQAAMEKVGKFSSLPRQCALYIVEIPSTPICSLFEYNQRLQIKCSTDTALDVCVKWIKLGKAVDVVSVVLSLDPRWIDITPTVTVQDDGMKLVFDPPLAIPANNSMYTLTFNTATSIACKQTRSNFQCFGSHVTIATQGIVQSVCLMRQIRNGTKHNRSYLYFIYFILFFIFLFIFYFLRSRTSTCGI